jgi:hypothetical protein
LSRPTTHDPAAAVTQESASRGGLRTGIGPGSRSITSTLTAVVLLVPCSPKIASTTCGCSLNSAATRSSDCWISSGVRQAACDLRLLKSLNAGWARSVQIVGNSHSQGCVILQRLRLPRPLAVLIAAASGLAIAAPTAALASSGHYHHQRGDLKLNQVNLASDIPGMAPLTDPDLKNPWGISLLPTSPCGSPIRERTAPPSSLSLRDQALGFPS